MLKQTTLIAAALGLVANIMLAGVRKKIAKETLDIWRSDRPRASKKKRRTKKG